jgi:hypothetical protein
MAATKKPERQFDEFMSDGNLASMNVGRKMTLVKIEQT